MKKYLTEFIGTFFLVLTIGCTVIPGAAGVIPPLAISGVLLAMIYAGGHISGAHYNPAVTLGLFLRGRFPLAEVPAYWISQFLGSTLAALAATFLYGKSGTPMEITNIPAALLAELLFTFALVYVVLNVATAKANENNSFYGLAIGFTVLAGAFSVGAISGGAFNPAVTVGVGLMKLVNFSQIWIHLSAQIGAAILAATVFRINNPSDN